MKNDLLKKYYGKVARQGMLKALMLGLITAFSALTIACCVCYFGGFKLLWLCLVIAGAVLVLSTPIFYFTMYRPDTKSIAKKIDECGLEERMLTMTEFANDDSFIAVKQREDATKALNAFDASLLTFALATPVIVFLTITALTGAGMTTVTALYQNDVIAGGGEIIDPITNPETKQFEVTYEVYGEGEILGEFFQVVEEGENATEVYAEAQDGWVFVGWAYDSPDNVEPSEDADPYRIDVDIHSDLVVYAVFQEAQGQGQGQGQGDGEGDGESDEQGEGQPQQGQQGQNGNGDGPDGEGGGAGGKYEENNQVIDGETYYGDEYGNSYEDGMSNLGNNDGYTDGDRGIASDYFDTIKN